MILISGDDSTFHADAQDVLARAKISFDAGGGLVIEVSADVRTVVLERREVFRLVEWIHRHLGDEP